MSNFKHIADERMIKTCEYIIKHNVREVKTIKDWCEKIGIAPNNINNIRNGKQSFSNEHIRQCCIIFNISADFIFGLTTVMARAPKKENPIQKIEAALAELKALKK